MAQKTRVVVAIKSNNNITKVSNENGKQGDQTKRKQLGCCSLLALESTGKLNQGN